MQKIKESEYIYASSRIKSAEGNGTFRERLEKMADSGSVASLYNAVMDFGIISDRRKSMVHDLSSAMNQALSSAVDLVRDCAPYPEIYDFLLFKYDCCNIKTAIKESILSQDYSELYFDCGTVNINVVKASVKSRDFSLLPQNMADKAKKAYDIYEQTGEARVIDIMTDCGCFEDIAAFVKTTGIPLFQSLAEMRADITNIKTSIRLSNSAFTPEAAKALMERSFVAGGTIPLNVFVKSADKSGVSDLTDISEKMEMSELKAAIDSADSLEGAERALEKCFEKLLEPYEYKAFGPEIPARFLILRESEITNCRIISAMISAGAGKEKIRERLGIK